MLLDELGAGTDPEEGAALAQALLNMLLSRSITTLATTHYSELKVFAHGTPFVQNASVEFDIETLSPTYRLSIGLPGRSNAFAIARRLGLPEPVVEGAEALVSPESLETETMLAEIKRARESALAAEAEARLAQRRAEALNADLRYRLGKIEEARREVLAETRGQAAAELEQVRDEIAHVQAGLADVAKGQTRHEAWLAEAQEVLSRRAGQVQPPPFDRGAAASGGRRPADARRHRMGAFAAGHRGGRRRRTAATSTSKSAHSGCTSARAGWSYANAEAGRRSRAAAARPGRPVPAWNSTCAV